MENLLEKVKTIVLLMFENRSFDHMLGHLSRQKINTEVNGLKDPLTNFRNLYKGGSFPVFPIREDVEMNTDLPHKREEVNVQLKKHILTGNITMGGFVEAYANITQTAPNKECEPMGFLNLRWFLLQVFLPGLSVLVTTGSVLYQRVRSLTGIWHFPVILQSVKMGCYLI